MGTNVQEFFSSRSSCINPNRIVDLFFTLLLGKLTTAISDIMVSLGNNISDFNRETHSIRTVIRAHG